MAKGWIKLHRDIAESFLYEDKPFNMLAAWEDMLILTNHKDVKTLSRKKILVVKKGTFVTSLTILGERWGWSKNRVKRFLDLIESEKMITRTSNIKGTIIEIVNWDKYQNDDTAQSIDFTRQNENLRNAHESIHETLTDTLTERSRDARGLLTRNKEYKECKELKNEKECSTLLAAVADTDLAPSAQNSSSRQQCPFNLSDSDFYEAANKIQKEWNQLPYVSKIKVWSPKRRKETEYILQTMGLDIFFEAIDQIKDTSHWIGSRKGITFDHFMNRETIIQTAEGAYNENYNRKVVPESDGY